MHAKSRILCFLAVTLSIAAPGQPVIGITPEPEPKNAHTPPHFSLDERLFRAIRSGDQAAAQAALEAGADPNATDRLQLFLGTRITPALVVAIQRKHPAIVLLLIEHGADLTLGARSTALFSSTLKSPFEFLVETEDLSFIREFTPRLRPGPDAFAQGLLTAGYLQNPSIFHYLLKVAETYMRNPTIVTPKG